MRFGELFKQARIALGLELREFCRQNNFDPGNVSKLENSSIKPPKAQNKLESYAKALNLVPDSTAWYDFFTAADNENGKIIKQTTNITHSNSWTTGGHLESWADIYDARFRFPQLIRRLISATIGHNNIIRQDFPAGEDVGRAGWDGILETKDSNPFIPQGLSGWEMGTDKTIKRKADEDFEKRTQDPLGIDPQQSTFIFVTPRKWPGKTKWVQERKKLGLWQDIRAYDSSDLEQWLETAPAVDLWYSQLIGIRPNGVIDLDEHWKGLSAISTPPLNSSIFLASRKKEIELLEKWLESTGSYLAFETSSPSEVIDFIAAYVASLDEQKKDQLGARLILIEETAAWWSLCTSKNKLMLIPKSTLSIEPNMINSALQQGHNVLLGIYPSVSGQGQKHRLSHPTRSDLEQALIQSGFTRQRARALSYRTGGSLTIFKRHVSSLPIIRKPNWSEAEEAIKLLPILLIGRWNDTFIGDLEAIEKLAECPYKEILAVANRWLNNIEDPILMKSANTWSLISREDSWELLAPQLSQQHLNAFKQVAIQVLSDDDSRYDLPPEKRWYTPSRTKFSIELKIGIAETLALLGAKKEYCTDIQQIECYLEQIVKALLTNTDWKRWASLKDYFHLLAEASPVVFLNIIETELKKDVPEQKKLFIELDDPIFSGYMHPGLLWALEVLAWNPNYLYTVSKILLKLDEFKLSDKLSNSPMNTLLEIYMMWLPHTMATVKQRLKILKELCNESPKNVSKLILNLIPQSHNTSTGTRTPLWRDWALNWSPEVSLQEIIQQIDGSIEYLMDLDIEKSSWNKLIEHIEDLPPKALHLLLKKFEELNVDTLEKELREEISNQLRDKVNRHGQLWEEQSILDKIKIIQKKFKFKDPMQKNKWLFEDYLYLAGYDYKSYDKMQKEILKKRQLALKEIVSAGGFAKLLELIRIAASPSTIGDALGQSKYLANDDVIFPMLLNSDNPKELIFASSYANYRFKKEGLNWLGKFPLKEWSTVQVGNFLMALPLNRETWDLAESLGSPIVEYYWSKITDIYTGDSLADIKYSTLKLLEFKQPFLAARTIEFASIKKIEVESNLIMDVLESFFNITDDKNKNLNSNFYDVQRQLLIKLQADCNIDSERLAKLEWQNLFLLDGNFETPKTLHKRLETSPEFYAILIKACFRAKNDTENDTMPAEQQNIAFNAYKLLSSWKSVPGKREDGTIDENKLRDWINTAISLCKDVDREEVGLSALGGVLAYAPEESDSSWPCIAVRNIIEEFSNDDLENGFEVGIYNKRGVVSRSVGEGGKKERDLAKIFSDYAGSCLTSPRVASSLNRIAQYYEDKAKVEDERNIF